LTTAFAIKFGNLHAMSLRDEL